jgi:tetratricopeptide (TPR) repeat protein
MQPSDEDDVSEMQVWDPHRAMKNVEVGDFYFKKGNYRAAESRYREALKWKSNDAVATFRLAQALEKEEQWSEAKKSYESYLKILPNGEFSQQAREGAERAASRESKPEKNEAKK